MSGVEREVTALDVRVRATERDVQQVQPMALAISRLEGRFDTFGNEMRSVKEAIAEAERKAEKREEENARKLEKAKEEHQEEIEEAKRDRKQIKLALLTVAGTVFAAAIGSLLTIIVSGSPFG